MGILKKISKSINRLYTDALVTGGGIMYRKHYDKLLKDHKNKHNCRTIDKTKEKEWLNLWGKLSKHPHLNSFRLFSQYIGPDIYIVPEDISSGIIQPTLNPVETRPFYQDKNMFDILLGEDRLPNTILRSIGGVLKTSDYELITPPHSRPQTEWIVSFYLAG